MGSLSSQLRSAINKLVGYERPERLGLFRILFGLLMAVQVGSELFSGSAIPRYSDTFYHFKYPFFTWVVSLPETWVQAYMWFGLITSVLISLGLLYRLASIGFFLFFLHSFLVDVSFYNNHYYAIVLFAGIMSLSGANRTFSIDKLIFNLKGKAGSWASILLRFQFIVIYFYGGLSKLFNEGWLNNSSTEEMLKGSLSDLGTTLTDDTLILAAGVLTIGGILFDLLIGFGLIYRKTFLISAFLALGFNAINSVIFTIGIFPFLMMGSLILFVPTDYSTKFFGAEKEGSEPKKTWRTQTIALTCGAFIGVQLLVPFRWMLLDVDPMWTGQGHLFSWNMKPGTKSIDCMFRIEDRKTKVSYEIDPHEYLSQPAYLALGKYPWVAPQFAKEVRSKADKWLIAEPSVKANLLVSFNRGPYYYVIDPNADLAEASYHPYSLNPWLVAYPPDQKFD